MKTSFIIVFMVLAMLKTQAQDYLISFAGAGDTNVVSTVKVENLASGATVTLGGDDVLHLLPIVGISTMDNNNGTLQIFPNPMGGQSILTFAAPENGKAVLSVVDLSGKTVCQISTVVSQGANSFRISGTTKGMYFVKVSGKNYNYSTKLISQNNQQTEAIIECIPSVKTTSGNRLKSRKAAVDMPYADGDQLLFKGISGIYSTIVPDIPSSNKTITFNFLDCTDGDNNNYAIVQIGAQIWMAENLRTTRYRDGSAIPEVTGGIAWSNLSSGAFCNYNNTNNSDTIGTYGRLYNWYAVNDICNLAPAGWHVASDTEWSTLTDSLGGEAAGKLKETGTTHWVGLNEATTNESGFTALPGGFRDNDGTFYGIRGWGYWWSSTEYESLAWYRVMSFYESYVSRYAISMERGYSVRCMRDL